MIDNTWYETLGDQWWDPSGPTRLLHEMNPARAAYFERVMGIMNRPAILDIGCGGGLLTECLARLGATTVGCDLSVSSLLTAARHGRSSDIRVEYVACRGESLPFRDASFDVVVASDFLEHVPDLDGVIAECARVLRQPGLFLYETINRTLKARLVAIWLFERVLGVIPKHTHDASMFVAPEVLHEVMARHGLFHRETLGLVPAAGSIGAIAGLITRGSPGPFRVDARDTSISYIGYSEKTGAREQD